MANLFCFYCFLAYHEVVRIPQGAVHVHVKEVTDSINYLGMLYELYFGYGIRNNQLAHRENVIKIINYTKEKVEDRPHYFKMWKG